MWFESIPITIAGTTNEDINSVFHSVGQSFQNDEPAKNIPGLFMRQCKVPAGLYGIQQFRKHFSSSRVWIGFHQSIESQELSPNLGWASQVKFGSFITMEEYMFEKWIDHIRIDLETHSSEMHIIHNQNYFRLTADCLDTYFLFDCENRFFLPLRKSVRCFQKIGPNKSKRIFDLQPYVAASDLADTSALHISLPACQVSSFVKKLTTDFGLQSFHSIQPIKITHMKLKSDYSLVEREDFLSNYAWEMILSLGYRIKFNLSQRLMRKINHLASRSQHQEYPEHQFYSKMIAVYQKAKNNRFFNIRTQYEGMRPSWLPPKQVDYDYVPRIFLTPYRQYPRPLKAMRSNRVLRQRERFGPPIEHFCRVLLRDCDLDCLQGFVLGEWRQQLKDILLKNGLIIANFKYDFLLFSNSQLRDRSVTFYRPYGNTTVKDIYQWLGQFNHEKSIGTRIARMAQCFTSTIHGIQISERNLEEIPDKFDNEKRCFTDGCGMISHNLVKKLFGKVREKESATTRLPSVIQIRCGGLKGVLVNTPSLPDDMIYYRPSQKKFHSNHNILELIKFSQPKGIVFNQQAITLLEYMGVPISLFLHFQYISRRNLSMALISKKSAISLLRRTIRFYDWNRIHHCGFVITQEPFFRSLLMTLCRDQLEKLVKKSHIPLPMRDGRMLFGIVDETDSLQEGEVFIQITEETSEGEEILRVIKNTQIIVTRMPCHHPGDIRLLQAVDKPALHHLVDCIVFPAKGRRPHPTEMSGGDLDGDEYWACWNEKLLTLIQKIYEPDQYTSPKKPICPHEPTQEMMIDCILDILRNSDQVGILSRRHLAISAYENPGNSKAIDLARSISDALDFPKTGVSSMTPSMFKNLNVHQYPDFMQNETKDSFVCTKVLGILFKYVSETLEIHESVVPTSESPLIDEDLLVDGYEAYLTSAKFHYEDYVENMNSILNTYDLTNETELITGCYFRPPEERQTNDDIETATQDFRVLKSKVKRDFERSMMLQSVDEKQKLVSAYYYVAYWSAKESQEKFLSFPWIFHEILCEIKKSRSNNSAGDNPLVSHQSSKLIGEALLASGKCYRLTGYHSITILSFYWLLEQDLNENFWRPYLHLIDVFVKIDERFLSAENSNFCPATRLGEQFLLLLEWLCMNNSDESSLEPIANLFLTKLHRIALKLPI